MQALGVIDAQPRTAAIRRARAGARPRRKVRGTVAIEFALLLALLLGGILLAAEGIGLVSRQAFAAAAARAADAVGGGASEDRPAARQPAANDSRLVPRAYSSLVSIQSRMGLLALMCALGSICLYALHRRRMKAKLQRRGAPPPAASDAMPLDRAAVFAKRHEILRILSADAGMLFESGLRVQHLMSVHVTSVEPETPAPAVQSLMREHDIRHLLVCQRGQRLVGIISDRDLTKPGRTARELMTSQPVVTEPGALISPAITQMIQRRISCLPVVHQGRLVGVLTSTDLMLGLQCTTQLLQRIAAELAPSRAEAEQQQFAACP